MKILRAAIAGLCLTLAVSPTPSLARSACCRVPAGTVVEVELAKAVSTSSQKPGDAVALRLAKPLVVDGRILLRAGTPGVGEVIDAARPGLGGKGGKLVLAARYLRRGRTRIPLEGLQLTGIGHDSSGVANAAGIGGIAFLPLGVVGMVITGGQVTLPAGAKASAKLTKDVTLASLGRAPRSAVSAPVEPVASGSIQIPPPPPGKGLVVFFRPKSVMGTGQWFNVRENGAALGKLTNGSYFVQVTEPGVHTYTASVEPEFKDHLKLEIDAGETYFVAGGLTKGVIIGAADLTPSDRASFNKAAKDLAAAAAPGAEKAASAAPSPQAPPEAAAPSPAPNPAPGSGQAPPPAPASAPAPQGGR